jgi:hypothetical protein
MEDLVRELDIGTTETNQVKQDEYIFYKFNLTNNKLITIQQYSHLIKLELHQMMLNQMLISMCQINVQTQQSLITNGSLLILALWY